MVGQNNLAKFDKRKYHFGFLLSGNSSSFYYETKLTPENADSILGISNKPQGGFNLNLLASLDISPNFHIRFTPGLAFEDRGLIYRVQDPERGDIEITQKTESVFLEFPLLMKFRTNRVGNFAAYAILGGRYGIDMQSQKDVNNTLGDDSVIIRLEKNNYSVVSGAGFDFFLPFFKFGIEFKTSIGIPNLLIQEDTKYSRPIESLKTRSFVVSLTFEG